MSHKWMRDVRVPFSESRYTYEWVMLLPQRSHVSHLGVLWVCEFIYIWMDHVAHSDIKRDVFIIRMSHFTLTKKSCFTSEWFVSSVTYEWIMSYMPHSDVWHDSFRCVTWLIRILDMTHSRTSRTWVQLYTNESFVHMDESCPKPLRCDTCE